MAAWLAGLGCIRRGVLLLAGLGCGLAAPGLAAAQAEGPPMVAVGIYDYAGVPREDLERALAHVSRWFAAAGALVEWVDRSGCDPDGGWPPPPSCGALADLALIIPSAQMAESIAPSPDVIGLAPGTPQERGRVAYAFYHRMLRLPGERLAGWMAVVTAHELGHLLLPHGAHAAEGLMRGEWAREELARLEVDGLGFTGLQARLIRQRLGGD